ncbi:MAG: ABC transporter ATP-binding protein [Desulfobacterales bacterium]|nr:ABC transporter ATP-binding protein [Desulfobacterales bacterium]
MNRDNILLDIKDLHIEFSLYKSTLKAIRGISLTMHKGETLGLVGESGCGKSITASSIMQLIPCPPGKIVSGEIRFQGENLLIKNDNQMREIRGKTISMIFQDPMTSLNPVFSVGDQIKSVIKHHEKCSTTAALNKAAEMCSMVGLADPKSILKKYPHELSGGMCQRIMIAMALSCRPSLLIADEPTTALDVTVQAQILKLMRDLKKEINTSILLITHDLGVVAKTCEKVAVMYAGRIVEYGTLQHIFKNPQHPYTQGLLASTPKLGGDKNRLETIEGNVPDLTTQLNGCLFKPRCNAVNEKCAMESPGIKEVEQDHFLSCHLFNTVK